MIIYDENETLRMNRFFRALIAGYGAKKLGGGCLSTILIFIVIYWALGQCNSTPQTRRTYIPPKTHSVDVTWNLTSQGNNEKVAFYR
jgi:hypothetical protein